jgi:hypothetical protein
MIIGSHFQIKQTKSKFAFGTAVKASYITDSTHKTYQDFIYNNFEWAVLENALKWRQMEWTKVNDILIYIQFSSFLCPRKQRVRGHINLPLFYRPFVHPDIDTWFVRLLLQFWIYSFNILHDVYTHNGGVHVHRILIFIKYLIMRGIFLCPRDEVGGMFVKYSHNDR